MRGGAEVQPLYVCVQLVVLPIRGFEWEHTGCVVGVFVRFFVRRFTPIDIAQVYRAILL
jgi:hypothetical protein